MTTSPGQWLVYLLCVIGPLAVAYSAAIGYLLAPDALSAEAMPTHELRQGKDLIIAAVPFFVGAIALELVVMLWDRRVRYRLNDAASSIFAGALSRLPELFVKGLALGPYAYIWQHWRLVTLPGDTWAAWLAMFVLVEYGYYWFHRMAHECNLGWATHVTHHNSEDYNLATALRQGALQSFASWPFMLSGAVLGLPLPLYVFHAQVNTLYQFWIHTCAIDRLPWPLELVLNTPSHHRVHHARNARYIDKNYGGTLIVFDRLFGTFAPEDAADPPLFGITHTLDSWSPVWAQVHHFAEMAKTSAAVPSWLERLGVWTVLGPGFNYGVLHRDELARGPIAPDTRRVRYNALPQHWAHWLYVLVHIVRTHLGLDDGALGSPSPLTHPRCDALGHRGLSSTQRTSLSARTTPPSLASALG